MLVYNHRENEHPFFLYRFSKATQLTRSFVGEY